jgi:hypothetical protein
MPKFEYLKHEKEGLLKVTSTDKKETFIFQGDEYSASVLRSAKLVKRYINEDHLLIDLVQDKYGRLFYNIWFEQINFGGGEDYIEESYNLVKDEAEANKIFEGKSSMYHGLGYIPFICWSEDDLVRAVERDAEDTTQS